MVAYSFRPRFVDLIYSGAKTQTIRAHGKKRHARPGEPVQLYQALRTKWARKIVKADPICTRFEQIVILPTARGLIVEVNGIRLGRSQLEKFAHDDGFFGAADFKRWWRAAIPTEVFYGVVIHWGAGPMEGTQ